MKIFATLLDYLKIIWMSFGKLNPEKIKPRDIKKPGDLKSFRNKYLQDLNSLSINEQEFLLKKYSNIKEEYSKETNAIENKAQSIISQMSFGITLFVVLITILTSQITKINYNVFLFVLFSLLIIIFFIVISVLTSRNVVVPKYKLPVVIIENIEEDTNLNNNIVEHIFINEHYLYVNRIKTVLLDASQTFYKIALIIFLLLVMTLTTFFLFYNTKTKISSQSSNYNINIQSGNNRRGNYDSLSTK